MVLALVLMLFGSGVGVAVAALRPQSGRPGTDALPLSREATHTDQLSEAAPEGEGETPAPPASEDEFSSADLTAVQRRLTALKYYLGPIDGSPGSETRSAVVAFQKVTGLTADGVLGPATFQALVNPVTPALRGGAPRRAEIDLDKQVLYYVEGGQLSRIVPVSSGNGSTYEQKDGGLARSLTPVGSFTIQRKINGVREADLGTLYDPMYFFQGWAIHGSNFVPAYPASHGCVRVSRSDALWLYRRLSVGTPVLIYGGTHTFGPGSSAPGTMTPTGDSPSDVSAVEPAPEEDPEQPEAGERTREGHDTAEALETRIVSGIDGERLDEIVLDDE